MLSTIKRSLPLQLLTAAILAWVFATIMPTVANITEPVTEPLTEQTWYQLILLGKTSYIGLLKMVIGLVVMLSLMQGITNIGSTLKLKTLGVSTLAFYSLTSIIAISLGLGAALCMPEWQPLVEPVVVADHINLIEQDTVTGSSITAKFLAMALVNPFSALVNGNLLAIVLFSLLFSVSLLRSLPQNHVVFTVIAGLNQGLNKLVQSIICLAPIAVFAIVFEFTVTGNTGLFGQLALFALLVFSLTLVHGVIVLPTLAKIFTGIKFSTLFKAISAPLAMAFATSSSSATLPLSMQAAEKELGVSQSTSSFVLPLGAVMNMDGTALFEGVAAIFLAQLFGIDLTTTGIVMIFIMAMVSSVGAPGMPSGSMSGMQLVMLAAGIPLEGIAILLIIERPLDTFRTAVNVEGDLIAALVVDKWQQ
ncbi:MAG: dicarboxylate/amino acid:cation symporter [Moritella sp.]|uniref:dicarboxylate/amino acid:cation symporter n=1 Tax=Moritella sp. TaxID=78556 RepID=UPI0029A5FD42|nr:dicarboxylate/amino acid:cation symporter [Moritella sp.]MDX2319364.1 dicarboxylate/amino acid:cation symporter [Moritella sp.]